MLTTFMLTTLRFIRVLLVGGIVATAIAPLLPAHAQLVPQGWGAVGTKDGEVSYAVGARWLDFGIEVGGTEQGMNGADVLKFLSLSIVSPYAGVGLYSRDEPLAYSAGVQVRPQGRWFLGTGYHSIRGVNGQLGIKF
ncbi:hypothetical protein [Trichothermofontia sp.]